jgi:hypothetical protein
MKNLGIITLNHKNRKVLALWCAQIMRLRKELDTYIPAVVVSDISDVNICYRYGVHHISYTEKPVTDKWNRAMTYMQSIGVDAVMITGSDDIMSTDFYRKTLEQVELGIDLIGVESIYFFCGQGRDRGQMTKLTGKAMLGIGKTISKSVLDMADWNIWRVKKDWGMDAIASKVIKQYAKTQVVIDEVIVDVKTRDNLNSFNVFKNRPQVDNNIFFNILSEEEKRILNSL